MEDKNNDHKTQTDVFIKIIMDIVSKIMHNTKKINEWTASE